MSDENYYADKRPYCSLRGAIQVSGKSMSHSGAIRTKPTGLALATESPVVPTTQGVRSTLALSITQPRKLCQEQKPINMANSYIIGDVIKIENDSVKKGIRFFDVVIDASAENEFGGIVRIRYRFDVNDETKDDVARAIYLAANKLIGRRIKVVCVAIDAYSYNVLTPSRYETIKIVDGNTKRVRRIASLKRTEKRTINAEDAMMRD